MTEGAVAQGTKVPANRIPNTQTPTPNARGNVQPQKSSDTAKSNPAAINHFADAANFQNNGAFELAVEEWKKLLKDYPKDPLASKASHYLGVCYMQQAKPDYAAAAAAFAKALTDSRLDVRDESLINLGWCQFMQARQAEGDEATQRKLLSQARETFADYIKAYPQGATIDQALFFTGEIEYSLGNAKRAIEYHQQLLKAKSLANSKWRPDAQYAVGVALEQTKQDDQARQYYEDFLKEFPENKLRDKVTLRLADVLLRTGKPTEAEKLLQRESQNRDNPLADYALLRLGQALVEQDKLAEAAKTFEQLASKFPKSEHVATAKLSAGQMYFRLGQYPEALAQFRDVMQRQDAQGAEAAHYWAMTMQRLPNASDAIPVLEEVLKWAGTTPSGLALQLDLADALYADPARLADALQAYAKIATEHPDDPLAPRATYNAAITALQSDRLDDAKRWAETFLKRYPQDPLRADVAYVASETLLLQGQHTAAIDAYTKLVDSEPNNPSLPYWVIRLSMAHYLAGHYQEAIKLLESKMPLFADAAQKAEAQSIMGSCYLFMDKPTEAIAQLVASHKTSDKWNRADEVLLVLAQAYQRQNDAASALKTLEELIASYPESRVRFQARYRMGQVRAAQQDFDGAIADYQAILKEPTASSMHDYARYGIALSLIKQEKYEAGLAALEPLLSAGRNDSLTTESLLAKAVCLRKLGRVDESIDVLNKFLETKPVDASLANGLYELGMAHVEKQQLDQAIDAFERVLAEVPDYQAKDKILYELGWAWADKKDSEKSIARFQELIDAFPKSEFVPEALYQVAQQHYDAKRYSEAVPVYTSVLSKADDASLKEKALYKLGWSLFQQEKYPQAAEEFAQQVNQFPEGDFIVDGCFMNAECLFKQDKFSEALAKYQTARQLLEKNAQAEVSEQVRTLVYLHGAQCLREQKKWSDCEAWLREIITRYPNSPYLSTVIFELATAKQNLNQPDEALRLFGEVASKYRDEIAARARFMMGELYFAQRKFDKAIPEFQRVMFGYGAEKADGEIKNWQARGGFEAGRCSEALIQDLKGEARERALNIAKDFYTYVIDKHPTHEVVKQAQVRLNELNKLR
ncbi:MAG: tetratricopeptide repeat protein [Aureliella sp.]